MKRLLHFIFLVCATLPACAEQLEWFTNVEAAQTKARQENKFVMLDFTGSDWSEWCKKLKEEVFDQPDFAEFANKNLVAVLVDFPHNKPLSDAQGLVNTNLVKALQITRIPTVVILDPTGRPAGETGYIAGGPGPFIVQLTKIIGTRTGKPVDGGLTQDDLPEPPRKPVEFVPIAPTVPTRYETLALKSISGSGNHRFALINNQTLAVGESGRVRLKGDYVNVTCKEIRDDSVLITVNGTPTELKLTASTSASK